MNIDLGRIKEAGYEAFGRPGLIREIMPIQGFGDHDTIEKKAEESLRITGMNLEECVGFAIFTRKDNVLNHETEDRAHYAEVLALKEIKKD